MPRRPSLKDLSPEELARRILGTQTRTDFDPPIGAFRTEAPVEGSPGWFMSCLFTQKGEELVAAELRIFPGTAERRFRRRGAAEVGEWDPKDEVPGKGVSGKLLRAGGVSVADIEFHARTAVDAAVDARSKGTIRVKPSDQGALEASIRAAKAKPPRSRTGRRGTPDEDYLPLAELRDKTYSKRPNVEIGERVGETPEWVRDHLYECRRRGLLDKNNRLTNKARAMKEELDRREAE